MVGNSLSVFTIMSLLIHSLLQKTAAHQLKIWDENLNIKHFFELKRVEEKRVSGEGKRTYKCFFTAREG